MTDQPDHSSPVVQRRNLLRNSALAAGAAAGAVALSATAARPASAATGDTITQGGTFEGTTTTTVGTTSATVAPLTLRNPSGPALRLTPTAETWDGELPPGGLLSVGSSVLVGLEDQAGPYTTYLATGFDVAAIPVTIAIPSSRLLDTRSAAGRSGILASGGGGLDSSGRLKAGAYIDVAVDAADSDFTLDGVFLNLTSTGSTGNGYLYAYPPGPKPVGSTTTYSKGVATSSSCLAAVGVVQDYFAVRIFSAALTHVVVDLTGVTLLDIPGPQATATVTRTARRSARRPAARRLQRTLGAGRR